MFSFCHYTRINFAPCDLNQLRYDVITGVQVLNVDKSSPTLPQFPGHRSYFRQRIRQDAAFYWPYIKRSRGQIQANSIPNPAPSQAHSKLARNFEVIFGHVILTRSPKLTVTLNPCNRP